ncbi:MAG TPA: hypothetical protein VFN21_00915 [Acidimicrobiales bacterium]|nr:hypothetical protein [Acidimicrobiales bacterium]
MKRNPSRTKLWLIGTLVCVVTACSTGVGDEADGESKRPATKVTAGADGPSGDDPQVELTDEQSAHLVDDADTTWDVELSDATTLVDGDALAALKSTDGDGGFTFDAGLAEKAGLDLSKGRVLLVAGDSLGRITDRSAGAGSVKVTTESASLADAIEDGTVGWDVPLDYDFEQFVTDESGSSGGAAVEPSGYSSDASTPRLTEIAMAMPDGRRVPVVSADDDDDGESPAGLEGPEITVKPDEGTVDWVMSLDGTKYQFRITAKGETATFLVVVSRGGDDPTMAYRGEGTVGALRSASSSTFTGGRVAGSTVGVDGLDAKLKLSASVAGAGVAPIELEVPVPMLKFIWMVGPIPVTVEIKANIVGNVNATAQASATAEASFSYRGDAGFSFDGGDISASGNTEIDDMDAEPADSAAPMGVQVDAQFGVAFPELSMSLFGQGFVPSVYFGAFVGSNLWWGEPKAGFAASSICKSAYVRAEVVGKYDFKVLGKSLSEGEHEFWKDRKDADGDTPGCDLKPKD